MINEKEILEQLKAGLSTFGLDKSKQNVGYIEKITDGIVSASGLSQALMGEEVIFANGSSGLVLHLSEDSVSIILLDQTADLKEGDKVKTTGKLLNIKASEELLGRIINPLGNPLDGKSKIQKGTLMPLEKIAYGVVERQPVDTPLKTGLTAIDAMTPIGRGQRELIIGDRGIGKTAIALDTIINQKRQKVICIYVAIGQRQSTIAQLADKLKEKDSMEYSIIVSSSASNPASLQYLAPYAGTAIAEYFLEKGKDVLIVYDDLTKHAWAYRQLSLILKRPAGREAYPGDVFYLHSRLLERSVRLNDKLGGGSITALPIIETQANDISAYIPTNVISITDGQIYLQTDLFNSGIKPAINVGNSVSRVGGAAQTAAMKSVAGKIRLELAQYRELAAFSQFGSELDPATLAQLELGKRLSEILKQNQYEPLAEALQIASIWAATNGYLDDIEVESCQRFQKEYHRFLNTSHKQLLAKLSGGEKLTEETKMLLKKATETFKTRFTK